MNGLLNFLAGFRCPYCKSRQEYWHVRRMLWINRIWPLFLRRHMYSGSVYREPELEKVRCYSCKMDLRMPKRSTPKIEIFCWVIACAILYAIMSWVMQQPALAKPPSILDRSTEEILERMGEIQRGEDRYAGRLPLAILAVCVAAPFSYAIGRFLSYRIIRLERNPPTDPLMPPVFEN